MESFLLIIFLALIILINQIIFRKNKKIENISAFKLVMISIAIVGVSIIISSLLGSKFYWLIIITTISCGSVIQINYSCRVNKYNETGK